MIIKKLKITNFKKFKEERIFEFNDDVNVIVGDNDSGKSTILEAIELVLNGTYRGRPLSSELSTDLFNSECIEEYISGDKSESSLPELRIEVFLDGDPDLKGKINYAKEDAQGISLRIFFNTSHTSSYTIFAKDPKKVSTLPVELYKHERQTFAWAHVTSYNNPVSCLFVDPSRLHPTYGRTKYINDIVRLALDPSARSTLNLNFRQLKATFDNELEVKNINEALDKDNEITDQDLKITADISTKRSWESGLQLSVSNVSFDQIGKGEQNQIQLKLALRDKAKDIDIIMVEEPENHLSHMNLTKLMGYLENKNSGKQLFVTTHSSYVLNKLSIDKLCLLSTGFKRLKNIDNQTKKTLKRLPGYDTLRLVLAEKTVLVEGPSDELVLKKIYKVKNGCLPETNGIDIIVVRGLGFKTYLNIAKELKHPVRVVRDNDGDYERNVKKWASAYKDLDFIKFFAPTEKDWSSLEPSLIESNSKTSQQLDGFAGVILSPQTYKDYETQTSLESKKEFLKRWFSGTGSGKKKVDSAIRIFDKETTIEIPAFLSQAMNFDQ